MAVNVTHTTPADGSFSATGAAAWNASHSVTLDSGKLLGRSTAGTGAAEEIAVGTGLSLSSGTLSATGSMVYPAAGIPNSTGSAWGTSYSTTGSGTVVALATSPVFTTPSLGVATATSVNGLTVSTTTGTLTLANGSTLATSGANSITFTSTAPTTLTLPTSGTLATTANLTGLATTAVGYTITGGGAVITTGVAGVGLRVPFACTINSVTLLASPSGSIVIDIWKDTYANFPPTVADSICASAKPTISSGVKSEDTTLTGWTTSIAAGDVLYFNVDSCSTITNVVLVLRVTKT